MLSMMIRKSRNHILTQEIKIYLQYQCSIKFNLVLSKAQKPIARTVERMDDWLSEAVNFFHKNVTGFGLLHSRTPKTLFIGFHSNKRIKNPWDKQKLKVVVINKMSSHFYIFKMAVAWLLSLFSCNFTSSF